MKNKQEKSEERPDGHLFHNSNREVCFYDKHKGDTRERVLAFRVTFDQLDTLKRTAKANGTTVSTVIRQAIATDLK